MYYIVQLARNSVFISHLKEVLKSNWNRFVDQCKSPGAAIPHWRLLKNLAIQRKTWPFLGWWVKTWPRTHSKVGLNLQGSSKVTAAELSRSWCLTSISYPIEFRWNCIRYTSIHIYKKCFSVTIPRSEPDVFAVPFLCTVLIFSV